MESWKSPQINIQQLKKKFKGQLLISLLALSLTTTIVLGAALPSYTQAPNQLTPSDEVIERIKQAAERHVDGDSAMQTSTVVNAFKDNQAGLAEAEILEIYETEYARLKAEKDANFWEQARPNAGWVVAILLGLLALFRNTLEEWTGGAIKAVGEGIYIRVGGRWLLQGLALRRYQKALFNKHKELHIPFRANRPLDMEEVYIPLKTEGSARGEQIDADRAIARYKRLMVTGPPGGGKSMLLRNIALSHGAGRLNLPEHPIPVLIELHRLSDPDLNLETLIEVLVEALSRDDFPNAERFVRRSLEQGRLFLLLDGLDEVNSDVRPHVVQQIQDLLDTYEDCRVVITCRTAVYRDEFATTTEQTLKVSEFSDQQIRRFLKAWESEIPQDKSIEQLLQALRNRPRIMELARNPLLLTIIAHLYSDPSFVLPDSRTEFYQESTRILLDQWQGKFNQHKAINKRRVLQHLALSSQTSTQRGKQDRRRMERDQVLQETHSILPALNLAPEDHTESILNEIVERSGLLLVVDGGEGYKFSHLTLQEYFAAEALKEDADGLINRFRQAPDEWREVVKLWCGFGNDSTALIQAVAQIDAITGFECLADAQEIDPKVANSIIEPFKAQLRTSNAQQEQVINAFGAVAANVRPRGQAVFAFLERLLNSPQEITRSQAAEALSKTNLPDAATTLGRHYEFLPEVRSPLTNMGDLAVPVLREIGTQQQLPIILKDLFTIGTPDAASVLTFFLWQGNSRQQENASWYLASLLPGLGIEDALRTYTDTFKVQNTQTLDWIWQPFKEPPNSTLPVTAGRIAQLISDSSQTAIPEPLPRLDPRLIIPLCAIHLRDQTTLPTSWPSRAETLREQQTQLPGVDEQLKQTVNTLVSENRPDSQWRLLLSGMTSKQQLDLLHRLIIYRPPSKDDWRNVFRVMKYEFRRQWQYRCVLLIAAALSILAVVEMGAIALQQPDSPFIGFLGLALVVVLAFWESLRKGIEQPFEPNTFLRLGLLGPLTFGTELRQLFQSQLVWPGIEALFKALNGAFAVAGAGAFAVAFAVAVAVAVAGAGAGAGAFAVAVAVAGAFAVAVAGAGAGAGVGLGAWYRLKSKPNERWPQFFAVLAFPWFCWFPIVIALSTLGLQNFFPLTWPSAISFNLFILIICGGLWWHGQRSEARARNPLRGIIEPEFSLRT